MKKSLFTGLLGLLLLTSCAHHRKCDKTAQCDSKKKEQCCTKKDCKKQCDAKKKAE